LDCGTGKESNCCNKHASCADWASRGECKKNPEWMLPNCQLSCRVCKTDSNPSKPSTATSSSSHTVALSMINFLAGMPQPNCRSMVAKGQAKDAYGGNAPRAARMKKMIYDCAIEESAMRHAKRCVFVHSPAHTRENLGEFNTDCLKMVWQDTYKLGCHVEWYSSMTYVVCQYGPKGNWLGNLIYDIGNSCTTDGDCKCDNCKCSKEEALCIVQ
ncbi:SCP-like protein, partial [Ancylostoma duodenale]